jgi:hypothetical protein
MWNNILVESEMKRNLIVYKVDYVNRHEDYNTQTGRFVRTKRIIMTPDEVNQTDGYWQNHGNVERKFFKQMEGLENTTYSSEKYRITRVRKA